MDRAKVLEFAAERACAYLKHVDEAPVAPRAESIADLARLGGDLPDCGEDPLAVVQLLDQYAAPATVANSGGRFFGFVNGGALPAAAGASWLVSAWDQNAAMHVMSPAAAQLEATALGWVCELLGLPKTCGGAVVTGATMASFCGLAAARHALLARAGWDGEADGLFGAPPLTVVVGDEVHASLLKALAMLGLGRKRVVRVATDGQGRMRSDSLPALDAKTIVCLQAGNVNTGAFDPAGEICERAREGGAWVHVDGAFGLWAAVSPKFRHLMDGFENADSWATDAHKWPNVGYDCGVAVVRVPENLRGAMTVTAAYFASDGWRNPMEYTPESSRRARGIELWAALRSLGRVGMADLVERTCRHARRFADALSAEGFAILNDVVINQVLVDFGGATKTTSVIRGIQEDGTCWCGGTVWRGRTAMRISVSSWVTTDADVERSIGAIVRIAKGV
jgi:glutamate/tyrosine decarboxylase-like PLP-dependent enzyme